MTEKSHPRLGARAAHAERVAMRISDRGRLVLFWIWTVLIFGGLSVMIALPLAGR
jgi:hypothetical protein